jgi:anthranilate phosphoribosyltransferase
MMSVSDILSVPELVLAKPALAQPSVQEMLKAIGRTGGKGLSAVHARQLFEQILGATLDPMQVGGALMALRVRGESREEVLGALDALDACVNPINVDSKKPVVLIPTYNGARLLPNLVPLLACLLADEGVSVVLHGLRHASSRVTTLEIFRAMGHEPVECEASDVGSLSLKVAQKLGRGDPAFVPVDVLSPALAGLLSHREVMGVRNTGHTLAKLVQPVRGGKVLQLACFTHAAFQVLQQDVALARSGTVLQSRGCEGEVVSHPRRANAQVLVHDSKIENLRGDEALNPADSPVLPPAQDAAATAAWIQSVLAGAVPVPASIAMQLQCIKQALKSI